MHVVQEAQSTLGIRAVGQVPITRTCVRALLLDWPLPLYKARLASDWAA